MKKYLIITLVLYGAISFAQVGFHLVYKITNVPVDTNGQRLDIYTQYGSSMNDYSTGKSNNHWWRTLRLRSQPQYQYLCDTKSSLRIPDEQMESYKIEGISIDTIGSVLCRKVSLKIHKQGEDFLVWLPVEGRSYQKYIGGFVHELSLNKLQESVKTHKLIGFPIKIDYGKQIYEFVSAEEVNLDASNFDVPSNITVGETSDNLKKNNKITDEQYKAMREAEQAAKDAAMKHAVENAGKK